MILDEGPAQDAISVNSDSTGYSSAEEEESMPLGGQVTNPMVVVSNRLPFVLVRKEDGSLERRMR
jgi:hypothetical protein